LSKSFAAGGTLVWFFASVRSLATHQLVSAYEGFRTNGAFELALHVPPSNVMGEISSC